MVHLSQMVALYHFEGLILADNALMPITYCIIQLFAGLIFVGR